MLRSLPFVALLAAAALPAQAIRYAPGEYKYSVATVIKQSQEMGDQKQASTINLAQRMAVLLIARGADSLRFRTTLEDYTISADLPIQLPDVGKLKGTIVEGVMTAYGPSRALHAPLAGDQRRRSDRARREHVALRARPLAERGHGLHLDRHHVEPQQERRRRARRSARSRRRSSTATRSSRA